MASFSDRIKVILDIDSSGGVKSLKSLKTSVTEAEGVFGKLKAGGSGAMATLGQNIGAASIAGGAALVAFSVKAVHAFEDVAKAAIDLSTSTGLSTEEASRWIGVADDYKVSGEALATGLGKIAKTLNDTKWSKYGIATRDAGGNARDVNDILLDTLDTLSKVENKTEQARIGQELFGKGYQSLTPILGHTRAEYEAMLGSVEKGQVITAKEAEKAEKMRLAEDQLGDAFKEVTLAVGGLVAESAPLISFFADAITGATTLIGKLKESASAWVDIEQTLFGSSEDQFHPEFLKTADEGTRSMAALGAETDRWAGVSKRAADTADDVAAAISETDRETRRLAEAIPDVVSGMGAVSDAVSGAKDEFNQAADAVKLLDDTYSSIIGKLDKEEAWSNVADAMDKLKWTMADTTATAADQSAQWKDTIRKMADYVKGANDIPDTVKTSILVDIDNGKIALAEAKIRALQRLASSTVWFDVAPRAGGVKQKIAGGTNSAKPGLALVGEEGPELVIMGGGEQVLTARQTRGLQGFAGGTGATVTGGDGSVWSQIIAPVDQTVEQAAEAADQITAVLDIVEVSEIDLARRRYKRGQITLEEYKAIVDAQLAISDAKFGAESEQSESLFDLQSSLTNQLTAISEAARQAFIDAEKAKQDEIAKTTQALKDQLAAQLAALLATEGANADLAEAIVEQTQAQSDYNQALNEYVKASGPKSKATADERAAALTKVAQAQSNLDKATIAGAKARAATKGAAGSYAYEQSLNSDLLQYATDHGDPTGALAQEAGRHDVSSFGASGGSSSSGGNSITIQTGADPRQVIEIIKRYLSNGGTL